MSSRVGDLSASGSGAQQHLDAPLAAKPAVSDGASLDLVSGHARLDQRLADDIDTPLAQVAKLLLIAIRSAGIHRAIDGNLQRWIFLQVGGNVGDLASLGRPQVGLVGFKPEVPVRDPFPDYARRALRAGRACCT